MLIKKLIQFIGSQTYVGKEILGLPMLFSADNLKSFILPVISLSIGNIAYYAMWALAIAAFGLTVYYTVKQL